MLRLKNHFTHWVINFTSHETEIQHKYWLSSSILSSIMQMNLSSRLTPYRASPSTDPDVRLSRIRLLAKLIIQQLSIDTDIDSRFGQGVLL